MPLTDILSAALSRPAGRVVDGPVRDIVEEVLRDKGFAGPAELHRLQEDVSALRTALGALTTRVAAAEGEAAALRADRSGLERQVEAATARAAAAEKRALAAENLLTDARERAVAAEAHAARVAGLASAAEERARAADDRAKVALNRTRAALEAGVVVAPVTPAVTDASESAATAPAVAPPPARVGAGAVEVSGDVVGPGGEVLVDGDVFRVDAALAGQAYEVRGTRSRRVRIGGRFVRKTRA